MLIPGLVSITFRQLTPADIIARAAAAGLQAIEWGGDGHVPHGDLKTARAVRRQTEEAGLSICAYGSYYRAGALNVPQPDWTAVLETALELGAPVIRVWAGRQGSAEATPADRLRITDALRTACAAAATHDLLVATEFHSHTLTDTTASAVRLLTATAHPTLRTFWQPPIGATPDAAHAGLQAVLPFVHNCHVFHWSGADHVRHPLAEGAAAWVTYFNLIHQAPGPHHACLEFLRDNDPARLPAEAATLRQLIQQATLPEQNLMNGQRNAP